MSSATLEELEEALRSGAVVGVPTDTVYGLAVDPRLDRAVDRLFAAKGRPDDLALAVLIADPLELDELAEPLPAARALAARYWPGPLTLVLRRRREVAFDLRGDRATIGIRCPAHPVLRDLLRRSGPLAVTSANRHGEAPLRTAGEVREHFGDQVPVVLDGGRCEGRPSSVVSLAGATPECLREGAVSFEEINAALFGPDAAS